MLTATAHLILPSTTTGSFPRPRWFDTSMWGRPLDTCMLDVRFREKFQDALAVVISDQERTGLDILTHGDFHLDEALAGFVVSTHDRCHDGAGDLLIELAGIGRCGHWIRILTASIADGNVV